MTSYTEGIAAWRRERDRFLLDHYATPLADDAIASFTGIEYYDVDERLVFTLALEPAEAAVEIQASTGSVSAYPSAGFITIPFPSGDQRLRVLSGEDDDMYLPFRDTTCGVATYGAGRYAPVELQPDGRVVVDFNKATNPYCAYDEEFSCPLPPEENHLGFPIEAGELDFT